MSFHPNDIGRRSRVATVLLVGAFFLLLSAFYRTQVVRNREYAVQSEQNRLREVPLPAPRAIIYDRTGKVIAENLPGYSVSILAPSADSLRASLRRLSGMIQLTDDQIETAVRRYRRDRNRPAVILPDASFDEVSVLEEHRVEFPGLIIQSAPKRYYPDGAAVASFVGYTGEISETELNSKKYEGYKAGQQIGKAGLERQYETELRGREGYRFVEVDAHGRVVRDAGARADLQPEAPAPLKTNIDLDLQRFVVSVFGDSLRGGAIAIEPRTGAVLALHSAPSFDPNRFIGGIPPEYYKSLQQDTRKPLYNKVIQGTYPPASTFKLATAAMAMERGLVSLDEHQPVPCTGGFWFGSRRFGCWDKRGHGNVTLARAIEKSCDVYFYQLGLKLGLSNLVAGGVAMQFDERTGIDLPAEVRPRFPYANVNEYYNKRYGARGWTAGAAALNLSIGQGENSQTVANMARFYTALATDGQAARPEIVARAPERTRVLKLSGEQMDGLRKALMGVVSARGTAGASAIQGIVLAGKTGTAQNSEDPERDHAWFAGFAPADNPKVVVVVMIEFGLHGSDAARVASKIVAYYLKATPAQAFEVTD